MSDERAGFHYDVSTEQLGTFAALTPAQRLRWLEETRDWTWSAASPDTRASWRRLREHGLRLEQGLWQGEHRWHRGDGCRGWIGGMHPVQGRGWIDGRPWDFRAILDGWGVTIAENPDEDAGLVGCGAPGWIDEGAYGAGIDASGMAADEAWRLVLDAFRRFRAGELRYLSARDLLPG